LFLNGNSDEIRRSAVAVLDPVLLMENNPASTHLNTACGNFPAHMRFQRQILLTAYAGVLIALAATPMADAAPQDVIFAGSMAASAVRNNAENAWCAAEPGPSTFEQRQTGQRNVTFPEISYFQDGKFYKLTGLARLDFNSASAGVARFEFAGTLPANVRRPAFSNFTQSFKSQSGRLRVSFNLNFADCVLPVEAVYRD